MADGLVFRRGVVCSPKYPIFGPPLPKSKKKKPSASLQMAYSHGSLSPSFSESHKNRTLQFTPATMKGQSFDGDLKFVLH
jgi:hypothetical protein